MYEDLVSLVVELSRRYTAELQACLDKHAGPMLTIAAAEEDIEDQGARFNPTAATPMRGLDAARLDTEQQREDGLPLPHGHQAAGRIRHLGRRPGFEHGTD